MPFSLAAGADEHVHSEPIALTTLTVRLRVETVWKGDLGPEVTMATGARAHTHGTISISSCDTSLMLGRRYLIFARAGAFDLLRPEGACGFTGEGRADSPLDLLDSIAGRHARTSLTASRQVVAVTGVVQVPGVIDWVPGLTVREVVKRAGGAVRPKPSAFHDRRRQTSSTRKTPWSRCFAAR